MVPVLVKIDTSKLNANIECDNLLVQEQAGFRIVERYVTQATTLLVSYERRMNKMVVTHALFFTLQKLTIIHPTGVLHKSEREGSVEIY